MANAKKKPVKAAKTKNGITYKDVELAYLIGGVLAVTKQMKTENVSAATVQRAAEELRKANPEVAAELLAFVADQFPPTAKGVKGKAPPAIGQERVYKAQQVGKSDPFLRLPLTTMGISKGGGVRVSFEDDKLVVTRA